MTFQLLFDVEWAIATTYPATPSTGEVLERNATDGHLLEVFDAFLALSFERMGCCSSGWSVYDAEDVRG